MPEPRGETVLVQLLSLMPPSPREKRELFLKKDKRQNNDICMI